MLLNRIAGLFLWRKNTLNICSRTNRSFFKESGSDPREKNGSGSDRQAKNPISIRSNELDFRSKLFQIPDPDPTQKLGSRSGSTAPWFELGSAFIQLLHYTGENFPVFLLFIKLENTTKTWNDIDCSRKTNNVKIMIWRGSGKKKCSPPPWGYENTPKKFPLFSTYMLSFLRLLSGKSGGLDALFAPHTH